MCQNNSDWKSVNSVGEVTQWHATAIGKHEGKHISFVLQLS